MQYYWLVGPDFWSRGFQFCRLISPQKCVLSSAQYNNIHSGYQRVPLQRKVNVSCQSLLFLYFKLKQGNQRPGIFSSLVLRRPNKMSNLGGTRINSFNENFLNECDQDANSVLTELDKGKHFAIT